VGTPFGVTVDFDTIGENGPTNEGTVTIRERDSMKQQRIGLGDIKSFLIERIS
jgi:glycyl-tRNA synthetase